MISVVVPVLDDADAAEALLGQLQPDPRREILLVDGGYDVRIDALAASRTDVRLVRTSPGRGLQMNAGADAASGAWLVFLHADSRLPIGWLDAITSLPADVAAGCFRFALDDNAWQARVIERAVQWRVTLFGLAYGDQGLFVRRTIFRQIGGYRELPLMEDVDLVRRLRRMPFAVLSLPLVTSSRRWRRDGWFRRSGHNVALVLLYLAGVSPRRLARWYRAAP